MGTIELSFPNPNRQISTRSSASPSRSAQHDSTGSKQTILWKRYRGSSAGLSVSPTWAPTSRNTFIGILLIVRWQPRPLEGLWPQAGEGRRPRERTDRDALPGKVLPGHDSRRPGHAIA